MHELHLQVKYMHKKITIIRVSSFFPKMLEIFKLILHINSKTNLWLLMYQDFASLYFIYQMNI